MWFAPLIEAIATVFVTVAVGYLKKRTGDESPPCPEMEKKVASLKKRKRKR